MLKSLSVLFPTLVKVVPHEFPDRARFRSWLIDEGFRSTIPDEKAQQHSTSPFVWFGKTASEDPSESGFEEFLGGHDDTLAWCRKFMSPSAGKAATAVADMVDDGHEPDHGYDYDLVVIGGG